MKRLTLLLSLVLGPGCGYRVAIETDPIGALLTHPDGAIEVAPTEVTVRVVPGRRHWVEVSAPGYRSLRVDLRKTEATFFHLVGDVFFHPAAILGFEPHGAMVVVLVPEHGPSGTWTDPTP